MSLTPEQETALRKPFQVAEHGFVNGKPYLKKDAIKRRLSQVDPGWQMGAPSVVAVDEDLVTLTAALIVADVARHALGAGVIQRVDRDGKDVGIYELGRNKLRAYKTADSDLIARCAMQFGVGEYLKAVPKTVKDERTLHDWLLSLLPTVRGGQSSGPPPTPLSTAPPRR